MRLSSLASESLAPEVTLEGFIVRAYRTPCQDLLQEFFKFDHIKAEETVENEGGKILKKKTYTLEVTKNSLKRHINIDDSAVSSWEQAEEIVEKLLNEVVPPGESFKCVFTDILTIENHPTLHHIFVVNHVIKYEMVYAKGLYTNISIKFGSSSSQQGTCSSQRSESSVVESKHRALNGQIYWTSHEDGSPDAEGRALAQAFEKLFAAENRISIFFHRLLADREMKKLIAVYLKKFATAKAI